MAYGSVLADVVQSSTAGVAPQFNDGNGTQTGTLCRAWVNFNGTGTVAIRASFNVSSITDNGTGNYTVNFTNALSDANYSVSGAANSDGFNYPACIVGINKNTAPTTSAVAIYVGYTGSQASQGGLLDSSIVDVAIFR